MSPPPQRHRLAARTWRSDGGRLLVGGWPPRRVRLSAAGAAALDELLGGGGDGGAAALDQPLTGGGGGAAPLGGPPGGGGGAAALDEPPAGGDGDAAALDQPLADGGGGAALDRPPAGGGGAKAAPDELLGGDGGGGAEAPGGGAEALGKRLRRAGLIDPLPGAARAPVTFVVPVRDGGAALGDLVRSLRGWGEVIVVDDGSADGSAARAREAGATVVANAGAPGPAGARNTGATLADTEFVAFLDCDCAAADDWARPLAALLAADPELALAAPRVRSARGAGAIAAYERSCSPLDMGPVGGLVGPGRRISFVPSTALVVRRSALLELGGFAEELRFGEDVDLVWRLVGAGWAARYVPELAVTHRPRPTLAALARQRFEYGGSAAQLDRRHPGAAAPLRCGRSLAPWLLAALAGPRAGLALATALPLLAAARQDDPAAALPVARLALLGSADAGRNLARALSRDWLPLTAAALASRRTRRLTAAALLADAVLSSRPAAGSRLSPNVGSRQPPTADSPRPPTGSTQRPSADGSPRPPSGVSWRRPSAVSPLVTAAHLPLRLADNAAYCAGLWRGALAHRSPRPLLPART